MTLRHPTILSRLPTRFRRMLIRGWLAVLLPACCAAAESGRPGSALDDWIADLGHSSFARREAAARELIQAGATAVAHLESAADSPNVERSQRAQQLLEEIDPTTIDFEVATVRLNDRQVTRIGRGSGTRGGTLRVHAEPTSGAGKGNARAARVYTITYQTSVDGTLSIDVEEKSTVSSASTTGLKLYRPLPISDGVSLLKRSEECTYRRTGSGIERQRERFVTLLFVNQRRRISGNVSLLPPESEAAYAKIVDRLLAQAASGMPQGAFSNDGAPPGEATVTALELLAFLEEPNAMPLFRAAHDLDSLRAVAATGLGEIEALEQCLSEPVSLNPGTRTDFSLVAAARLLRLAGSDVAFDRLREALLRADTAPLHFAMATLADFAHSGRLSAAQRERFVQVVLGDDFLSRAIWRDEETTYLVTLALRLIDPTNDDDLSLARNAQRAFERLFCGELGLVPITYPSFLELWLQAQKPLGGTELAEVRLCIRLLPCLSRSRQLSQARMGFENRLDDDLDGSGGDLAEILSPVLTHLKDEDPTVANDARQLVASVSEALSLRPQWLQPMVEALLAAGDGLGATVGRRTGISVNSPRRNIEQELRRWSGVAKRNIAGTNKFGAVWRNWMEDSQKIEARRQQLGETAKKTNDGSKGAEVRVHSFDLVLQTTVGAPSTSPARLLDGRSIDLERQQPIRFRDAADVTRQFELISIAGAPGKKTVRLRVDGAQLHVTEGIPLLRPISRRGLSPRTLETCDLFFGARYVSRRRTESYRTLTFVELLDPDDEAATAAAPPRAAEEHWTWFLKERLLTTPKAGEERRIDAAVNALEALNLPGALPYVKRAFEIAPTAKRAKLLHRFGDPAGLDFLRQQLETGEDDALEEVALELSELGDPQGIQKLLTLLRADTQEVRFVISRALTILDRYLREHPEESPVRSDVLDYMISLLRHRTWQYRAFRIVEREVGIEFGFSAAQSLRNVAERRKALDAAAQKAQTWWEAVRRQGDPSTDPPPVPPK